MILPSILLFASLAILFYGADLLVKGASSIALRIGISPLIVGLTVVSLGTSAPELLVSLSAAWGGNSAIAVGNVVGSNIFNVGIILGLCAITAPLMIRRTLLRQDAPIMVAASALFIILFWDGHLSRFEGIIFTLGAVAYTLLLIMQAKKMTPHEAEEGEKPTTASKHWIIDLLFLILGLAGLVVGSNLLVDNAVLVARMLGISESIIGLTIVAAGTSTPELATSLVATIKGNKDIAIGNVIGSNLYNLLLVMGVSATITPVSIPTPNHPDLLVMFGLSLLILPMMKTGMRLSRTEGAVIVTIYIAYLAYLIHQALI